MVFTFVNLLSDWETLGVFDYVLPFILIFALVYGILTATQVLGSGNKGVNIVVALAVGLLALRFDYVPVFFSEIFPRLGIGLAVLLVLMILTALFIPKQWLKGWSGSMWAVGAIVAVVVIYKSFDILGWNLSSYGWWTEYGSIIILGLLLLVIIFWMASDKIEFKGGSEAEFKPIRS
jgi:hypothetical protein